MRRICVVRVYLRLSSACVSSWEALKGLFSCNSPYIRSARIWLASLSALLGYSSLAVSIRASILSLSLVSNKYWCQVWLSHGFLIRGCPLTWTVWIASAGPVHWIFTVVGGWSAWVIWDNLHSSLMFSVNLLGSHRISLLIPSLSC